jgi:hypothetical protein
MTVVRPFQESPFYVPGQWNPLQDGVIINAFVSMRERPPTAHQPVYMYNQDGAFELNDKEGRHRVYGSFEILEKFLPTQLYPPALHCTGKGPEHDEICGVLWCW